VPGEGQQTTAAFCWASFPHFRKTFKTICSSASQPSSAIFFPLLICFRREITMFFLKAKQFPKNLDTFLPIPSGHSASKLFLTRQHVNTLLCITQKRPQLGSTYRPAPAAPRAELPSMCASDSSLGAPSPHSQPGDSHPSAWSPRERASGFNARCHARGINPVVEIH